MTPIRSYKDKLYFFAALFGVVSGISLSILYMVLIEKSVSAAGERRAFEEENAKLARSVAALESEYLAKSGAITRESAREMGFADAPTILYVTNNPKTQVVSLR